jgi:hypothetical protein
VVWWEAGGVKVLNLHSRPEGALAPSSLVALSRDAVNAWRQSKDADTAERCLEREEVALIDTFSALCEALVTAGVSRARASEVFRELVDASEVLR